MNHDCLEYRIDRDDGDIDIGAIIGGVRIGHVRTVRDENRLLLAELRVEDAIRRQWPIFPKLLRSTIGERAPWSARGHGVGRELLKRVLAEADVSGVRETWGSVMSNDVESTPHLLDWYKRLGFSVAEPDDECVPGAAMKIVRLRPTPTEN